jgi:hypothetical protein
MKINTKFLAFLAVVVLIGASAGLSVINSYVSNTGQTVYSSTEISSSGVRNVQFYNDGGAHFAKTETIDSANIDEHMSGDFSGFTVFSELSVVNNTGGEQTMSVSNNSMAVNKQVSMGPNSYATNENFYLKSVGENSYRSELVWWTGAGMNKYEDVYLVPFAQNSEEIEAFGTGHYTTEYVSPYPTYITSNMYLHK